MRMPVLFSWSGGKDSAMALHSLLQNPDFEVVALLTTVTEGYERVSMHGVRRELLHRQAESVGLPLEEVRIPPQCVNPVYDARMGEAVFRFRDRGVMSPLAIFFLRICALIGNKNLLRQI
jgi:diphthamide synthase (EF-2-diphthine--ammonia ligase)